MDSTCPLLGELPVGQRHVLWVLGKQKPQMMSIRCGLWPQNCSEPDTLTESGGSQFPLRGHGQENNRMSSKLTNEIPK